MTEGVRAFAIVVAAGDGTRLEAGAPKALVRIGGEAIVSLAVRAAGASCVAGVIVAAPADLVDHVRTLVEPGVLIVAGGATRQDSVRRALEAVPDGVAVVAIHDAARPFATPSLFDAVIAAAASEDAAGAIPVVPVIDTVKRVADGVVLATELRDGLVLAQTPQAFALAPLRDAHERAAEAGESFTDDAAAVAWAGYRVRTVPGEPGNFKITTPADLERAEAIGGRADG
jgi:2-C-methyl-D-erythritol 4-phosphate cytidylyltransferase/2-C-methyl-D-erythritol 2,4-cyclodiphosphate synthase